MPLARVVFTPCSLERVEPGCQFNAPQLAQAVNLVLRVNQRNSLKSMLFPWGVLLG